MAHSQVTSSCVVPPVLHAAYQRDVVNLAMTAMDQQQSPDTALVRVPSAWLDPIEGGLAAIFNATSIPERDSVFNLYCVHDMTSPIQTYPGYLMEIDTSYAWTQAWQNLSTLTGNLAMDSLLLKYDLHLTQYFNWSFGQYVLLSTDSLWNNGALIDSLLMVPGVIFGEPDQVIGAAGSIDYSLSGTDRIYHFNFEFNDCFDGCDNLHQWRFKVAQDCSVEYLGFVDWGVFGIEPLPAPLNCNLTTYNVGPQPLSSFQISPNPTRSMLRVEASGGSSTATIALLYDATGRHVLTSPTFTTTTQLDMESLPVGIYSLVLRQEGLPVQIYKVLKQ